MAYPWLLGTPNVPAFVLMSIGAVNQNRQSEYVTSARVPASFQAK
jgi:hypothetical protein